MTNTTKRILVMMAIKRGELFRPVGFTTAAGYNIFWYNTDDNSTHITKLPACMRWIKTAPMGHEGGAV